MFCILVYKEYKEMLKFDILMLTTEGWVKSNFCFQQTYLDT